MRQRARTTRLAIKTPCAALFPACLFAESLNADANIPQNPFTVPDLPSGEASRDEPRENSNPVDSGCESPLGLKTSKSVEIPESCVTRCSLIRQHCKFLNLFNGAKREMPGLPPTRVILVRRASGWAKMIESALAVGAASVLSPDIGMGFRLRKTRPPAVRARTPDARICALRWNALARAGFEFCRIELSNRGAGAISARWMLWGIQYDEGRLAGMGDGPVG